MGASSSRGLALGLAAALALAAAGCGDPVERNIAILVEGGEGAERAKMELNLAKKVAIAPLIAAFQNRNHPYRTRVDLAEALYRLYVREADDGILQALVDGLQEPDPKLRSGLARILADLGRRECVDPLIERLAVETVDTVRSEILLALEIMGMGWDGRLNETITQDHKIRLTEILRDMPAAGQPDTLGRRRQLWLETFAEEVADRARKAVLQADLEEAQRLYAEALTLVPESPSINRYLGQFHYFNGDRQEGLRILDRWGLVAHARPLKSTPRLDGDLDDPAWCDVTPLTGFYQCIRSFLALPTLGRSEAFIGYVGQTLYIGVRGYEESTDGLAATVTERDQQVFRDDCVELFFDPTLGQQAFYQIIVNSLGTIQDIRVDSDEDLSWNADIEAAARVAETFWSVEVAVPVSDLDTSFSPGDVWGFNVSRVRIAYASELGQWAPTHGSTQVPDKFGFLLFH